MFFHHTKQQLENKLIYLLYIQKLVMEGYCVRCKSKQAMKEAQEKTTANGRRMMSGKCTTCATKVNVFVGGGKPKVSK